MEYRESKLESIASGYAKHFAKVSGGESSLVGSTPTDSAGGLMNEYPGYEEIGRCNPEWYYTCDRCGADEFGGFDENGHAQGYNRIFRVDTLDLCEYCLQDHMEKK